METFAETLSEPRSVEHYDLLERSTKKAKSNGSSGALESQEVVMETSMEAIGGVDHPDLGRRGDERPLSFKEACMGLSQGLGEDMSIPDYASDDDVIIQEEEEEDCPTIALTKEEKARLRNPWRLTLIIKVMGRKVSFAYLLRRIKSMWRPKAPMEMVAIDNDYFLVRFQYVEDYKFTKYEGPWMVLDHYLIVN